MLRSSSSMGMLAEETGMLAEETGMLSEGTGMRSSSSMGMLAEGTGMFAEGGMLAEGTGMLSEGRSMRSSSSMGMLAEGTGMLAEGTGMLAEGTGMLSEGTGMLAEGCPKRSIVATESEDSDVFTFLDIPLNDGESSQRSSQSKHSTLDSSSGRAPLSILRKLPSYSSLSNLSNLGDSSAKSNNSGRQIFVEEPETDSFQAAPKMKRVTSNVSFQSVNVREYDRTLGDNPSCMSGPPISLDWSYSKATAVCIDEYEGNRKPKRNNSQPMRMNKFKRENMLKSKLGYSEEEIETAKKEKKKLQRNRSISGFIAPFWRLEHACESAIRKLGRKTKKDKKSDDLSSSTRSARSISSSLGTSAKTV